MTFITHIRPALIEDCANIYQVHLYSVQYTCKHYYTDKILQAWTQLLYPESYLQSLNSKELWVIEYKGNIQGFFQLDLISAELDALYVHPFVHNMGLGTAMIQRAEKIAFKAGLGFLKLYASMNSIVFYELNGYEQLGPCELHLNPEVTVDCILMRKYLNEETIL